MTETEFLYTTSLLYIKQTLDENKVKYKLVDIPHITELQLSQVKTFIVRILVWTGSPSDEKEAKAITSPASPTSPLKDWDPMKEDFLSSKNSYAINSDDLDIVFQGHRKYPSFAFAAFNLSGFTRSIAKGCL